MSIVGFSRCLCQGVPCKAENWHALFHEQYFSKHLFLDICRCAFKKLKGKTYQSSCGILDLSNYTTKADL